MNKRKKRVLFSWFFTGWLAATRWEWQDQPWLVNYSNWLISISTNVLLLLALCEIVTYSTFTGCSASILVISIGVFCFRAELQIETTQDYATDSWFFNVFTGLFSLRTNSPFGVFARIHVTAVHEVTRVRGAGKGLLFPTPRGFAVRSRVLSLRAPKLENSESTLRIKGLSVRTILWGGFCYSCSIIRIAREKKMATRAPFESRVWRLFSLAAHILREAFLCLGVVGFVSLL